MAALLHPGVYVQEVPGGARSIEGVPTSTAIFVGETERGPLEPTKIRGATDFARLFGGYLRHANTGALRVTIRYETDLFFQNGGTVAYILRASANGLRAGRSFTINGTSFRLIEAASPGEWGNHLHAVITHRDPKRFRITVYYRAPGQTRTGVVEDWDQVSMDPLDPSYAGQVLKRSSFIRWLADDVAPPSLPPGPAGDNRPAADFAAGTDVLKLAQAELDPLVLSGGGTDATLSTGDLPNLLHKLDGIDDAALLVGASGRWANTAVENEHFASNDEVQAYYHALQGYADARPKQDLFYIADVPAGLSPSGAQAYVADADLNKSNFVGMYWPHLKLADPAGVGANPILYVPPSGAVAGLYARIDAKRGVFKAPAGVEAGIGGILGLEVNAKDSEQDDLNPIGLNAIRPIPGAGVVVWGTRTLQPASEWRYVSVRRTAMYLRKSIYNGIQFAVFEPNSTGLWGTLRATIDAFMSTQFRNGFFAGKTANEAYFVKVDAETTTEADQAAGVVNILVGFAPLRPAEFVVVKLSQKTASSA